MAKGFTTSRLFCLGCHVIGPDDILSSFFSALLLHFAISIELENYIPPHSTIHIVPLFLLKRTT